MKTNTSKIKCKSLQFTKTGHIPIGPNKSNSKLNINDDANRNVPKRRVVQSVD